MSRAVRYGLEARSDDGRRVRMILTPASNGYLPLPLDIVELPYKAFVGPELKITGGWKDRVISLQEESIAKVVLDFGELVGSPAIEAARTYLAQPRYENGITLTLGTYARTLDSYNVIEIYDDAGTGDDPDTLLWIGVQTSLTGKAFDADSGRPGHIEIECVDLITWALQNTIAADVSAYVLEHMSAHADGPYTACRGTIFAHAGKRYSHAHGDHPFNHMGGYVPGVPRRQLTFYHLDKVYEAIGETVDLIVRRMIRKDANIFGITGTPLEHWQLYWPDFLQEYEHDTTAGTPTPAALGFIRLLDEDDNPTAPVGGFFHIPREGNASRDQLASWPHVWQFLKETTEGLVAKVPTSLSSVSVDNAPLIGISFLSLKEPVGLTKQLGPDAFNRAPKVTPSVNVIDGISATMPAGSGRDQSKVLIGTSQGEQYSMPRTWHTLPSTWPDRQRTYNTQSTGASTFCDIYTTSVNCLTLWGRTNAGGILDSQEYVRLHHYVAVNDGSGTHTTPPNSWIHPAPSPIGNYQNSEHVGDAEFGQRLFEIYLAIQATMGMPAAAGKLLLTVFDDPVQYEVDVALENVDLRDLGNRVGELTFLNGNVLLDGATYLGGLAGEPQIASMEADVLLGVVTKLRLDAY